MLQRARSRAESSREVDRGTAAKEELGRVAVDAVEQYFPDETRSRRRRSAAKAFVLGVAVGTLGRMALRGRR